MSDPYIQNLFADRIGGKLYGKGTEIYKFEKIKRAKRAALQANPGAVLIDMGVGEPDEMAFPECIEALNQSARLTIGAMQTTEGRNTSKRPRDGSRTFAAWMVSIRSRRSVTPLGPR